MIRRLPLRAAVLAAVVLTAQGAYAQTKQAQPKQVSPKQAPRNAPAPAPAPAQPAAPASIQVRASVDRTAIWVADRVTYAIDIVCARGVEILLDDLAKEKLRLNGLEVVSSDSTTTTDAAERTTYRLRYVLSTYRVDVPALSIDPLSARYYERRPGQRISTAAWRRHATPNHGSAARSGSRIDRSSSSAIGTAEARAFSSAASSDRPRQARARPRASWP